VKVILYARVSSKEQEKEGYSIPAQLRLLKEYAQKNSLTIVKEFIDIETAKQAGRANFGEMIRFLEKNPAVKIILVEKTDRLYRNFKDYVTIDDLDLEIHLVKEGEVLSKDSKSHQKFIHGIKVLMAKNYIDNLSDEVKKGFAEKVMQGGYPNKAPLGYINNKETHIIEIDSKRAPFIKLMFEWYASGNYSISSIRQKCIEEGFTYRKSEKYISRSNVERILKNIFYVGYFKWDGKIYEGSHPPIISKGLFDSVQEAFRRQNKPKHSKRRFAFAGLLTCEKCGCTITAEIKKQRYTYYHCTGFKGKCGNSWVREEELEDSFGEIVRNIRIDRSHVELIKEALRLSHTEEKEYHDQMIKDLSAQYMRIQNRLDQAYIDKLDGKIVEEFWLEKSEEWRGEQQAIREKIHRHENANVNYFDQGVKILELAHRAYPLYLSQNAFEKRKLLDFILSNCTLNDGILCPTYRKPFDILAKGIRNQNLLGDRDSNPDKQIQSLLSCRWTIPQFFHGQKYRNSALCQENTCHFEACGL
jgi:site-specific DNA recombinase